MSDDQILIVDDNPVNLKLVKILLRAEGYTTLAAGDAEEAVAILATFHPRLILMDIQMPGMDGIALTRQLKAAPATREIVIIAMTAYAMKGDEQKALAAGCNGYITKPIDTRSLPGVLRGYLFEPSGSDAARLKLKCA